MKQGDMVGGSLATLHSQTGPMGSWMLLSGYQIE